MGPATLKGSAIHRTSYELLEKGPEPPSYFLRPDQSFFWSTQEMGLANVGDNHRFCLSLLTVLLRITCFKGLAKACVLCAVPSVGPVKI